MGFRFRKSFKTGPFRATISKSGISTSFGTKGARITKKANGNTMTTLGTPGTGISYVSETSKKKTKNTAKGKNIMNSTFVTHTNKSNYIELQDPQTIGAPVKMGFLRVLKGIGIFLLASIILLIVAVIVDIPILVGLGWVGLFIWGGISCEKWRKSYESFWQPVSFENWTDYTYCPNMFEYVKGNLTEDQLCAYATIVGFCNATDKIFTPAEVNSSANTTISNYMFNRLYDYGYLLKPSRGKYSLNMDKVITMQTEFEKAQKAKEIRYESFVRECEKHNEEARVYNANLIAARIKKTK